jgi:hypothetical protein
VIDIPVITSAASKFHNLDINVTMTDFFLCEDEWSKIAYQAAPWADRDYDHVEIANKREAKGTPTPL